MGNQNINLEKNIENSTTSIIQQKQQSEQEQQEYANQVYEFAIKLKRSEDLSYSELKNRLIEEGLSEESAGIVVNNTEEGRRNAIKSSEKSEAERDMLYGTLWCVGGTVLTIAEIGFIFWGAIIFGAFQFLKGLFNYLKSK